MYELLTLFKKLNFGNGNESPHGQMPVCTDESVCS